MKAITPINAARIKKKAHKIHCFCGALLEVARGGLKRSLNFRHGSELMATYHAICPECGNIHEVDAWWRGRGEALEPYEKDVPIKVLQPAEAAPRKQSRTFTCRECKTRLEDVVPRDVGSKQESYQDEPDSTIYYIVCCACDQRVSVLPWWRRTDREPW